MPVMVMTSLRAELFSVSTVQVKEKHKREKGKLNFYSRLFLIYLHCTPSFKLGIFFYCHSVFKSIHAFFKTL